MSGRRFVFLCQFDLFSGVMLYFVDEYVQGGLLWLSSSPHLTRRCWFAWERRDAFSETSVNPRESLVFCGVSLKNKT